MQILVENSTWINIGDAFYQTSLFFLLKKIFPQHTVRMTDGPVARAFRPSKYFQKNAFDIRLMQDMDVFCLSGPILGEGFFNTYREIIERLSHRGCRYILLSAHGHEKGPITKEIKEFLKKYPPLAFSSRDEPTFNIYSDICERSYNGVCTAFFVSQTCPIASIISDCKYITLSIYTGPDPEIDWEVNEKGVLLLNSVRVKKKSVPYWRIARHLEWLRRLSEKKKEYAIIRPVHDISYKFSHLNFAKANSFLSYNPFSYLSLYSGTALTISDRVHACAVTLSYGKPALFLGQTGRSTMFSRIGLNSEKGEIMQLPESRMQEEYDNFCAWLRRIPL